VLSYANVGATSLFTTVEDLARWIANFEQPRVGSAAVLSQMMQKAKLNSGREINYGSGLGIGEYRKARMIEHGGADAGYRSVLIWFPDQHLGVALLSNFAAMEVGRLGRLVSEMYLYPALAPLPEPKKRTPVEQPNFTVKPELLERYAGQYQGQSGRVITISYTNGELKGDVVAGRLRALMPVTTNEFILAESGERLTFELPETGKALRYTLLADDSRRTYHRTTGEGPAKLKLDDYVGIYRSEELEVACTVLVKDGGLSLKHRRHGELALRAASTDTFTSSTIGRLRFQRNAEGQIAGFQVNTGRVRNLVFTRSSRMLL
jgi:hypothetical protein